ncbi:MAG TPA: hypothetical protein VH325_09260 [Bryobacteraceae bacterium]|jgi:hypothetical protein|nr:hypothetical protein [Bryobacteraceae bacterium]
MYRRSSISVALLMLAVTPARATSIVILRSPDAIYVGADSRRTYRKPGKTYAGSVCKIVPAGRFIFLASGLTYANGQQVSELGVAAARDQRTAADAIGALRLRLTSFLPNAIVAEDQVEQTRDRRGGRVVLEAAYVGFRNGIAEVVFEWFGQDSGRALLSDRRIYDSPVPGRYDFIFAGRRRAIDGYMAQHSVRIGGDLDAIRFITQAIRMEIAESPQSTAPPIDILQITAAGRRWLQHKPGCEITEAPPP